MILNIASYLQIHLPLQQESFFHIHGKSPPKILHPATPNLQSYQLKRESFLILIHKHKPEVIDSLKKKFNKNVIHC